MVELAQLRECMEEHGKEEVEVEYSGGEVNGASLDKLEMRNKWAFGGGIVCAVFDGGMNLELEECSREGKELGT